MINEDEKRICNYLDIPLQHINDAVLQAMKRSITEKEQDINRYRSTKIPTWLYELLYYRFSGETKNIPTA